MIRKEIHIWILVCPSVRAIMRYTSFTNITVQISNDEIDFLRPTTLSHSHVKHTYAHAPSNFYGLCLERKTRFEWPSSHLYTCSIKDNTTKSLHFIYFILKLYNLYISFIRIYFNNSIVSLVLSLQYQSQRYHHLPYSELLLVLIYWNRCDLFRVQDYISEFKCANVIWFYSALVWMRMRLDDGVRRCGVMKRDGCCG